MKLRKQVNHFMTMIKIKRRKLFLVFDSCQDVSSGNHVQNCDK